MTQHALENKTGKATATTTLPRARRACLCSKSPLLRRTLQLMSESQASLHYQDAHVIYVSRKDNKLIEKVLIFDQVASAHTRVSTDTGWVPTDLKRWGSSDGVRWALKYIPPQPHRLILPRSLDPTAEAAEEDQISELMLPGLVFFGHGTTYYVWATRGKEFDPKATLLHAPLPNVYDDGHICWGNNTAPEVAETYCDPAWSIFQRSPYTSNQVDKKSRRNMSDVRKTLLYLACKRGRAPFPITDLVPFKLTVAEAVEHITAGRQIPNNLRK
jgi:PRTRC genetic system protein B